MKNEYMPSLVDCHRSTTALAQWRAAGRLDPAAEQQRIAGSSGRIGSAYGRCSHGAPGW